MSIVPLFYQHQSSRLGGSELKGVAEGWIAPLARFSCPAGFGEEVWMPAVPETLLAFRLSGAEVVSEFGQRRRSGPGRSAALQPAGTPNHYNAAGHLIFAQVYLSDALLDRAAAHANQPALSGRLRDDLVFMADRILEERLFTCADRAFGLDPPTALEIEGRVLLILDRLIALHGAPSSPISKGGLAPWQVRRVIEYLQDHLAEDVSLAELATLLDLSSFHLCRAFKQSTGLPPHRWRHRKRMERARELLEGTVLPITAVAAAVGYDDPSRMAAGFRKAFGVTPTQYRRERRS